MPRDSHSPLQWFCKHDEKGAVRKPKPLDPSLATDDCLAKAAMFMVWISKNAPGWNNARKNAEAMVGGELVPRRAQFSPVHRLGRCRASPARA